MPNPGPRLQPVENLIARGSRVPRAKAHAAANLPACQDPRPAYPPNLKESARPYFDGICGHLEGIKRLRAAFAPAVVMLANLQTDLDALGEQDRRVSELQARLKEPTAEELKEIVLMESRLMVRRMGLTDRIIKLMDRLYLTPEALEGVTIPRTPDDQSTRPVKAPLRRGL